MSAPVRVPAPGEVIAVIRNSEDMREALRAIKAIHGLSNTWCDDTGGLTSGHTDKVLGPSATKGMSAMTFDVFAEMFAVEFHMVLNMDAVRRMEDRWKRRSEAQVAIPESRMSKKLLAKAKRLVLSAAGRAGGLKSASLQSAKQVRQKGGKSRAKKLTKQRRREIARKAGIASGQARRRKSAAAPQVSTASAAFEVGSAQTLQRGLDCPIMSA